jgi:beta-aspartyl-peptidase (threonine type)
MKSALIVHGGAAIYPPQYINPAKDGCREGLLVGWQILQSNGSALDAVEAAVQALEDDPLFNAGTGSSMNSEGNFELDAGIMDGARLQVGSVAGVELIKNPIRLARKVLESPYVLLIGYGAKKFALEHGMSLCTREDLLTERAYTRWQEKRAVLGEEKEQEHGTVGAVALDSAGHLAAATSTGGTVNKYPGRVGDSPLVGCGFYADSHAGVSCTGYGEDFTRFLIAKRVADRVAEGLTAQFAADEALAYLGTQTVETGGLIVIDAQGNIGFANSRMHMPYAYISSEMLEPEIGI